MQFSSGCVVSDCCSAPLLELEIDICSSCLEHCDVIEELEYED